MRAHEAEFSVAAMARVLAVNPSGYYAWRGRRLSVRAKENERLLEKIKAAHEESRRTYGSPKRHRKLRGEGEAVNHKRVERLMRENGITAKRVKKFRQTTDSRHSLPVAENVLGRNFSVARPDEVWTTDITYIWTDEGCLFTVLCSSSFSVDPDLVKRHDPDWIFLPVLETTPDQHRARDVIALDSRFATLTLL